MRSSAAYRVIWFLALLIAVLGALISFTLALEPYKTPSQEKGVFDQLCTAFVTSSCEEVSKSRWGWFPPKPSQEELARQREQEQEKEFEGDESDGKDDGAEQGDQDKEAQSKQAQGVEKKTQEKKPEQEARAAARIPSGQLGLIYFTFMVAWLAAIGFWPATRMGPYLLFTGGALLGAIGSAAFEYIMWTELDAWCPLCLAAHVASFLMPVFALLMWPRRGEDVGEVVVPRSHMTGGGERGSLFSSAGDRGAEHVALRRVWPTNWGVGVTLTLAIALSLAEHFFILNYSAQPKIKTAQAYSDYHKKQWQKYERHWMHHFTAWGLKPVIDIPIEDRPVRGPENARHELVLFSDFACPACRTLEERLSKYVIPASARYGGLRIVFKHYPLCTDCNDQVTRSLHPAACAGALAVEAARIVGGDEVFWKMHDLLFEHQAEWSKAKPPDFTPYAKEIGLDLEAFREAMASSEALARVRQDIADGVNLGQELPEPRRAEVKVDNSTPTVFVNGRRLDSPSHPSTYFRIMQVSQSPRQAQQAAAQQPAPRPPAGPSPATRPAAPPARVP